MGISARWVNSPRFPEAPMTTKNDFCGYPGSKPDTRPLRSKPVLKLHAVLALIASSHLFMVQATAQGVALGMDRQMVAATGNASAASVASVIGTGHFDVMLRQSMRQAWEDFGKRTQVNALWIGPDIAAMTQTDIANISIEDLGRRIVAGANLVGTGLRLQVYRDEAGVLRSVRILPNTP